MIYNDNLLEDEVRKPVLPDYSGACITNLLKSIKASSAKQLGFDRELNEKKILVLIDGLGWENLNEFADQADILLELHGGPITTVAPSTTAAAFTSISTGAPPAQHGLVGYKINLDGSLLNVLQWQTEEISQAEAVFQPSEIQQIQPFKDLDPLIISRERFIGTGFTEAHLRGNRFCGYKNSDDLTAIARSIQDQQDDFIYLYYDGLDHAGHESGLGRDYGREVAFVNELVDILLEKRDKGTSVIVSADHGMVDCSGSNVSLADSIFDPIKYYSGEGRFRWLHVDEESRDLLYKSLKESFSDIAWVYTKDELIELGVLGAETDIAEEILSRYGDIAITPFTNTSFEHPREKKLLSLKGRHGGLTPQEMYVPCLIE